MVVVVTAAVVVVDAVGVAPYVLAKKEIEEQLVSPDLKDHLDCRDSQDLKDPLVLKERKENLDAMDQKDYQDPGEKLVYPVFLEHPDVTANLETKVDVVNQVSQDATGLKENVDQKDHVVAMVNKVTREWKVHRVQQENPETLQLLHKKDKKENQEKLEMTDQPEILVRKEIKVHKVKVVGKDLLA